MSESTPSPSSSSSSAPWHLVWTLSATSIVSWGTAYYAFGVMLNPMQKDLGWSLGALTGAYSLALGIAALVLVPTGAWIDRVGGRLPMTLGSILAAAMFALMAINDSLIGFYLIWAGLGLVMATTFYEAAFAVIEMGFGDDYRRGITVLTFAGGLASTFFIPITQWLINGYGWRGAAFGLALSNLLICVPLHWRLPARSGHATARHATTPRASARAAIRRALRSVDFWTLVIGFTAMALSFGAMGVHLIPLLGAKGFTTGEVVLIASLIGPMQVAGRLAQFGLGDAIDVRRLSRIVFAMMPVAMAILLLAPAQSLFIGFFVVFYGASLGMVTILRGTAMPELFGRENYALLSNLLSAPSVAARAIAPFLASLIVTAFATYRALEWAMLVAALLAFGAIWIATRRRK